MTDLPVDSRDEIELVQILRIIWKWKYLILVGTAAFALVAGVISSNRPKVYRISMVLKPSVVRLDRFGRKIYLDSAANMKALIEAGTFNNGIKTHLEALEVKNRPRLVKFRVTAPRRSALMKISYDTQHVDTGILILNHIPELLQKEYAEEIIHFEKEYNDKIQENIEDQANLENDRKIIQSNTIIFEKRLKELILAINNIENNNRRLAEEKESYNKNNDEVSVNIDLLYNSAIQQNLQLMNEYKMQFSDLLSKKESTKLKLKLLEERIRFMSTEIADLKKQKSNIKYIEVLQTPTSSRSPIKPKPKVAVIMGLVVGLFVGVFSSFSLEYLLKHRK
jgi:capsular polysaccharide biosynthesis protein